MSVINPVDVPPSHCTGTTYLSWQLVEANSDLDFSRALQRADGQAVILDGHLRRVKLSSRIVNVRYPRLHRYNLDQVNGPRCGLTPRCGSFGLDRKWSCCKAVLSSSVRRHNWVHKSEPQQYSSTTLASYCLPPRFICHALSFIDTDGHMISEFRPPKLAIIYANGIK